VLLALQRHSLSGWDCDVTLFMQLKKELAETDSVYDTEKLSERIAKLSGGVAVIKVSHNPLQHQPACLVVQFTSASTPDSHATHAPHHSTHFGIKYRNATRYTGLLLH
jgi:hypothetical protein